MNRGDVKALIHGFLGEPTYKTWTESEIENYIQMALDDISSHGVIKGTASIVADGSSSYNLPSNMLRIDQIDVDSYIYYLIPTDYKEYFATTNKLAIVNENAWTVDFYESIDSTSTILCHGCFSHPEITDDKTEFSINNKYKNYIVFYCLTLCFAKTEDQNLMLNFQNLAQREALKLNLRYKIRNKVNYFRSLRL